MVRSDIRLIGCEVMVILTVEDVGGGRFLPDVGIGLSGEGEVRHDGGCSLEAA